MSAFLLSFLGIGLLLIIIYLERLINNSGSRDFLGKINDYLGGFEFGIIYGLKRPGFGNFRH